ncbi:LamG-like jellyroll fold domain-containing protein, partial [Calditrichota bacterium]
MGVFPINRLPVLTFLIIILLSVQPKLLQASNTCLNFDINDLEEAQAPNIDEIDIDGDQFTVECWINPTEILGVAEIIASLGGTPALGGWKIRVDADGNFSGRFGFDDNGLGWVAADPVEENTWTHVAMTYDGEAVRMYVNGEFSASGDEAGNILTTDEPLRFNRREADAANFFHGQIDEFRLWEAARTENELAQNMNRYLTGEEEGLVAYYSFDEGEGQVINDKSVNENHGWIGADEDEDDRDPEWMEEGAPIFGGELEMDEIEGIEFALLVDAEDSYVMTLTNVSEEADEAYNIDYWFEEDEDRPAWLTIENEAGEIEVDASVEVTFTASAADMETGIYSHVVVLRTTSQNIDNLEIPVTMQVVAGYGSLTGTIFDAANDEHFAGVEVAISGDLDYSTNSNDDGDYVFDELPAGEYVMTVIIDYYIPF